MENNKEIELVNSITIGYTKEGFQPIVKMEVFDNTALPKALTYILDSIYFTKDSEDRDHIFRGIIVTGVLEHFRHILSEIEYKDYFSFLTGDLKNLNEEEINKFIDKAVDESNNGDSEQTKEFIYVTVDDYIRELVPKYKLNTLVISFIRDQVLNSLYQVRTFMKINPNGSNLFEINVRNAVETVTKNTVEINMFLTELLIKVKPLLNYDYRKPYKVPIQSDESNSE